MADKNMDGVVDDLDIEILRRELLTGEEYVPETQESNENQEVTTLSAVYATDEKQYLSLAFDRKPEEFIMWLKNIAAL